MHRAPSTAPVPLLTAGAVARQLGASQSWVYLNAEIGVLPHRQLGGEAGPVRFMQAEIDAYGQPAAALMLEPGADVDRMARLELSLDYHDPCATG
jgi:predicted DNA-binding transcriptional regulator AlpA